MNDLIGKLSSLASGRFLLAYFVPILTFVASNLVLINECFPEAGVLEAFYKDGEWKPFASIPLLIGVIGLAYVLAPLSNVARAILEGSLWPNWLQEIGRSSEQRKREDLNAAFDSAATEIDIADEDPENRDKREEAETRLNVALARYQFSFSHREVEPTSLGNLRAALRDYAAVRYGIEFEIFWEQLKIVKAGDAGFESSIADSDARLEFTINMFFVAATFLPWPFVALWSVEESWLAVWLATATLIALIVYYGAIKEAYRNVIYARRAALDVFRFDVLRALRLRRPAGLANEKLIWEAVHRHAAFGESPAILYGWDDWK